MIALYIKSIDNQQQVRSFNCLLNQLEVVLGTLSLIAAAGNTFLEIYLIEDGHRTTLPPQAFDGQDMAQPIRALQAEWEAVLSQPVAQVLAPESLTLLEMTLQRVDQFETLMAEYDSSIARLEKMMLKTQERLSEGPRKNRLLQHYHGIVSRHYQSMGRAQTERDKCLKKLSMLKPLYLE